MVHDLELVLALVDSPVTSVSAVGAPVVTAYEDFAEARIVFGNGCVAELKASRTSPWAQRQMAIYDSQRHVFVDFGQRSAQMLERSRGLREGTLRVDRLAAAEVEALRPHIFQTLLPTAPLEVPNSNPLQDELRDFFACVRHGGSPRVDGPQAARAVWLAEQVVAQIQASPQRPAIPPHRRAA
jgi:predicted dehydrogenase